jgi:hypothetical protein
MGTVTAIIIGVITGFAASMTFWLWQARLFQPKIKICPMLADYTLADDPDKRPRCEFTFLNRGHRAAADLTITAQAVVPGLMGDDNMILRLREDAQPWASARNHEQYFLYLSRISDDDKKVYGQRLPEHVAQSLRGDAPEVSIREFVTICEGATVEIFVAASDSVFGGRCFVKQVFGKEDFRTSDTVFRKGVTCGRVGCCQARRSWLCVRRQKVNSVSERDVTSDNVVSTNK